jgi:hypothetical protein
VQPLQGLGHKKVQTEEENATNIQANNVQKTKNKSTNNMVKEAVEISTDRSVNK